MGPATALGLVASVLQIMETVPQVKRYLTDVVNAPRQAENLRNHYRSLRDLSSIVDEILKAKPELNRHVKEFQSGLKVLDPLIAPDQARGFNRLTWANRSPRKEIMEAIQRDKDNLTIALQANASYLLELKSVD